MSEQAHEAPDLDAVASNVEDEQVETQVDAQAETEVEPQVIEPTREETLEKVVAEKAFKAREASRENADLKRQIEELNKAQQPDVPKAVKMPDRWEYDSDDEYSSAVNAYADARAEQNLHAHNQNLENEYRQRAENEKIQKANETLVKQAGDYSGRAAKLGVKPDELANAGAKLQQYGINSEIATAILQDEIGPLVTQYLASNPSAIEELNNSTWSNGATIYNKVREAAGQLKPKTSNAPPPVDTLTGGAAAPSGGPPGVTYE